MYGNHGSGTMVAFVSHAGDWGSNPNPVKDTSFKQVVMVPMTNIWQQV